MLLPGVVDRHVHLGLVDRAQLADSAVVQVLDLGWDPAEAVVWRATPPHGVQVRIAGPFHTAVGGYPSGRAWAPDAAVRQLSSPAAARAAIAELVAIDPVAVKVALNASMPLLDEEILRVLIDEAHDVGLPVWVHAEGAGQAQRAIAAGADALVHVPWTEEFDAGLVRAAAERGMVWISTLAIHAGEDRARAIRNAAAFVAAGGTLRYGTDMGNGPRPVGVDAEELRLLGEAGLRGPALLAAVLDGPAALDGPDVEIDTADDLIAWLAAARRVELSSR